MKYTAASLLLLLLTGYANAQYWFGPKVGVSYTNFIYQDVTYEKDSFNVDNNISFNVGVALNYTATDRYSVYTELIYERIKKHVKNKNGNNSISSKMTNNYISVPVMLRVSLGRVPFHYYINGGPKVSYWLSGNGVIVLDEFQEFRRDPETGKVIPYEYDVSFSRKGGVNTTRAHIDRAERLQFGLVAGAGAYFDLANGARLMVDFRYDWGHSNMGFNYARDLTFDSYRENLEYSHNIASVSVGYLFGYNADLKRKGKSTIDRSNRKKKK